MGKHVSDDEFIEAWKRLQSPAEVSRLLNMPIRNVYERRRTIENRHGIQLATVPLRDNGVNRLPVPKYGYRRTIEIKDGEVFIGSDGHFWPGERSVAFDAFIKLINIRKPCLVVFNGDALDGSKISRHAPGGWANLPDLADELAAVQERMEEIAQAADDSVPLVLCAGNHDSRFSARLAQAAPDFVRVHGTDLADHLPAWQFCWSLWINDDIVIKHRWHQGIHAGFNNVVKSGKTIITGHTHRLLSLPYEDYTGKTRFGIECGTLAEISTLNDKFSWTEDNPLNWHPGFLTLKFENGQLIDHQFCRVKDGTARYMGEVI